MRKCKGWRSGYQRPPLLRDTAHVLKVFRCGRNIVEISKKLDYALSMLAEVARAESGQVVSVRQVSENDSIPYAFACTI